MKQILLILTSLLLIGTNCMAQKLQKDVFTTDKGREIEITFIKHGTLLIEVGEYAIHIDPVSMFGTDYSLLPKADMIIVSHEHADHYDLKAIEAISKDETLLLGSNEVSKQNKACRALSIGENIKINEGLEVTAVPAYNYSKGHTNFHPKERKDIGVLIDIDNIRIYIAGDTENIPELSDLSKQKAGRRVDIAFLPVNQPYTMTVEQCIDAVKAFSPRILYPYHYGQTDLSGLTGFESTEVRIRDLQ